MRTHLYLSIFAWRIPWTDEPGGLQSMGSYRDGYDSRDIACMHTHVAKTDGSL